MRAIGFLLMMAVIWQLGSAEPLNVIRGPTLFTMADKIREALEKLKQVMKTGSPENDVPVLDPLSVEHFDVDVDEDIAELKGEVNNLSLKGLSNYVIEQADFKLAKKNLTLTLSWPEISGEFHSILSEESIIMNKFPVYGNGKTSFTAKDLYFATEIIFLIDTKADTIEIKNVNKVDLSIGDFKIQLGGLYYDEELSELISAVISDNFADFMETFNGDLTKAVGDAIFEAGNDYLKTTSWSEIKEKLGM